MPLEVTRGQSITLKGPAITISSAASSSQAFAVNGYAPVAIYMPSTTAGTKMGFLVGSTSTDMARLYNDDGTPYTVTVQSNAYVRLDSSKLTGFDWMQIQAVASDGTTSSTMAGVRNFYMSFI